MKPVGRAGAIVKGHDMAIVVREIARRVLLGLAHDARAAGEDTFAYGLMHQRQACQAAALEQALPRLSAGRRGQAGH